MRILITGGSGFVGSHVVEAVLTAGHEAVVFDLAAPPRGWPFVKGDLTSADDVAAAAAGADAIFHLGGVGDVYLAFEQPPLAAAANVVGTAHIMEAARRHGVKKVVYASTWEVYGEPQYQPLDEAHPCRPDHPYNVTKLAGEQMTLAYDRLKDVPAVSLRLGTAYGERMRPNAVIPLFIQRARKQEPITIKGTGEQSRQFTHASDIGRAFLLALEKPVRGEVFNIVAEEPISIRQLAEMVTQDFPTEVRFEPARVGDIAPARVTSAKAERVLGWKPQVAFRDGLLHLMDWYENAESQNP
jgi:UDP-glucose 4-epimerase